MMLQTGPHNSTCCLISMFRWVVCAVLKWLLKMYYLYIVPITTVKTWNFIVCYYSVCIKTTDNSTNVWFKNGFLKSCEREFWPRSNWWFPVPIQKCAALKHSLHHIQVILWCVIEVATSLCYLERGKTKVHPKSYLFELSITHLLLTSKRFFKCLI